MLDSNFKQESLGIIRTVITGRNRYGVPLRIGERLRFQREPDNAHDWNAVRVLNHAGEKTGYLPRRLVTWLSPLLDARAVSVDGKVAKRRNGRPDICPIDLRVRADVNGSDLLRAVAKPTTLRDALHNLVVQGCSDAKSWEDPVLIREFLKRLWLMDRHDLAPESRLLLSLLPQVVAGKEAQERQNSAAEARESLLSLCVGDPVGWKNLQLFPLTGRAVCPRDYVLLSEAISAGDAEVREVSEAGSVPELVVVNRGDRPVLIPEGEILTGAKQNRVVNVTVLVAAKAELVIPVSCVERGRWAKVSPAFRATHFAPPRARARKCASVCAERAASGGRQSDQASVWANVGEYLNRAKAQSHTESLTDAYEQVQERLKTYRENVSLPDEAVGAVLAVGGKIVGLEVFDTHETLAGLWERLSEAYFFEAATNTEDTNGTATVQEAQRFLENVANSFVPVDNAVGAGVELEVHTDGVAGNALWHGGRLLHAAAFEVALN